MKNINIPEYLILKLKKGTLTQTETDKIIQWYNDFDDQILELPMAFASSEEEISLRIEKKILKLIHKDRKSEKIKRLKTWSLKAAAVLVALNILGALTFYFYLDISTKNHKTLTSAQDITVSPGTDQAVLTLADGKKIELNSMNNGIISTGEDMNIVKENNGNISYIEKGNNNKKILRYNILETPKGGQYHLVLPDGSHVWLNAKSRIRFPQRFVGDERKVYLEGEAFFDVRHDNRKFLVEAGEQEISVLGTAFNIKAYTEEKYILTTLTRGIVKVKSGENIVVLQPGLQAYSNKQEFGVKEANLTVDLAWKNGKLAFDNTDIGQIMREVSRWYDIEVQFPKGIPPGKITGGIDRSSNLRDLLKILEYSNLKFRMEEHNNKRTLIVLP